MDCWTTQHSETTYEYMRYLSRLFYGQKRRYLHHGLQKVRELARTPLSMLGRFEGAQGYLAEISQDCDREKIKSILSDEYSC